MVIIKEWAVAVCRSASRRVMEDRACRMNDLQLLMKRFGSVLILKMEKKDEPMVWSK